MDAASDFKTEAKIAGEKNHNVGSRVHFFDFEKTALALQPVPPMHPNMESSCFKTETNDDQCESNRLASERVFANQWMTVSGLTAMKHRGLRRCKLISSLGEFFISLDIIHAWGQGMFWFRGSTCISLCCHQSCGAFLMSLFKMCIKTGRRNSRRLPVLHWSEQGNAALSQLTFLFFVSYSYYYY